MKGKLFKRITTGAVALTLLGTTHLAEPGWIFPLSVHAAVSGYGSVTVSLQHESGGNDTVVMNGSITTYPDSQYGERTITINKSEPVSAKAETYTLISDDLNVSVHVTLDYIEQTHVLSISSVSLADNPDFNLNVSKDASVIQFYTVTVAYINDYGTVEAQHSLCSEGETFILTVTPDEDYVLKQLIVRDAQGREVRGEGDCYEMPASDVTAAAEFEPATGSEGWTPNLSWRNLQTAFSAGGSIILQQDYTAGENDTVLTVPSGVNVTLDLNGHTIDRGLANGSAKKLGNVITNNGTLTITDSSEAKNGKITGGNNAGDGGAILNSGTLTFSSGEISGNTANLSGGAIYISGGTVTITGGLIAGNTAASFHGGAVYICGNSTLNLYGGTMTGNSAQGQGGAILIYSEDSSNHIRVNLKGNPVIQDNQASTGANIYLRNGANPLYPVGLLDEDARIGVTLAKFTDGKGFVTSGFGDSVENSAVGLSRYACFTSDNTKYAVGFGADYEVFLADPVTVSFSPGQGTGEMEPVKVATDSFYTLPACTFTPPSNKMFCFWSEGDSTEDAGTGILISADLTLTAQYVNVTYQKVEAVPATLTEDGNTEYYIGSDGRYFVYNGSEFNEIQENSWIIPKGYLLVDTYKAAGTVPEQTGKVFAGWFADSAFTTPYTETTGNAYAKFVDAAVHITKAQLRAETTAESDSTDIRFVSTVDALDYAEVGFYITYGDKTVTAKTKDVYKSVNGASTTYTPTHFSEESSWFFTYLLTGVPKSAFDGEFTVQAYWKTLDGTVVTGAAKTFTVSAQLNH